MKIFVSYTTRNNEVTEKALLGFSNRINSIGKVFVDLLDNNSANKQDRVISELENSDILVLLRSPSTYKSEWVNFELEKAKKWDIPIVEFQISEIDSLDIATIQDKIFLLSE